MAAAAFLRARDARLAICLYFFLRFLDTIDIFF